MYSQKDEERYIVEHFKGFGKGRFLDFGGYDPKVFSNTRRLYELGWKGIYLEPSKPQFEKFVKEYDHDEEMTLINKAVTTYDGEVKFYNCNDGPSTTDVRHKAKWMDRIQVWNEEVVPCIAINTLLEKFAQEIDFLNIDVEGTNIDIFRAIDPKYFKNLKMICIEHDDNYEEMVDCLNKHGFQLILFNVENIILVRSTRWTIINKVKSKFVFEPFFPWIKRKITRLL